jgi:DNA repair protein RecO (recombination protein O)
MSASTRRVQLEPAFLLHHYPWRESSRILEFFTRGHGRVSVFARAARRGSSSLPSTMQLFGEMLVSWSARGEAGQLTGAEPSAAPAALAGDRLMSGFYVNELLIRLLQRHDPHPALYDAYAQVVAGLRDPAADQARSLRIFEKRLLEEIGWGLDLVHEAGSGGPIEPQRAYRYRLDGGAEAVDGAAEDLLVFPGESLLSLACERLDEPRHLADARRLLRAALDQCLDGRPLRTREVMRSMRAHGGPSPGG